jgi:NADH:ubiquinone oxidoreductase subunit 5 (subunit L)/multisubunit Na+/H+ antiporter MnhA subunit
MEPRTARFSTRQFVTGTLALAILVPSLWGFGSKFVEFIALYRSNEQGAFAIMPVLNYLLASSGFLMLFCWAVLQGMFRDIERPKYTMLENERRLDEGSQSSRSA